MAWHLGVDLGATTVLSLVTDGDLAVRGRDQRQTPRSTARAVTEAVLSSVRAACDDACVCPGELATVGIGSIGPLDAQAGAVLDPVNLEGTERIELVEPLRDLVGDAPVRLVNDATAAALGEYHVSDRSVSNLVYLTISTGIGAGVVVDGHLLSGRDDGAGEVGHWTVDPDGAMTCGCGSDGHWEAYCSGANLPGFARHLADVAGVATDLPLDDPMFVARDVYDAVGADPVAERTVAAATRYNAIGVANVVQAYAPETVVVGGGVALGNPELVVEPVAERVPDRILGEMPTVELPTLGEDAVALGALCGGREGAP